MIKDATVKPILLVLVALSQPAATFTPKWSVDKDLNGWEVCLAY